MRLPVLIFFALWIVPLGAVAQEPSIERIDLLEAAIFNFAGDLRSESAQPSVVEITTVVPGRIGVRFGFRYVVVGTPAGAIAQLRMATRVPQPGWRNPKDRQRVNRMDEVVSVPVGSPRIAGFSFDETWEIVPGEWVFELWDRNRKLAEQKFTVTR